MSKHTAMSALGKRAAGGLQLPALGFGGAGVMLGGAGTCASPKLAEDGDRVGIGFRLPTDLEARANLEAQWSAGMRYFDTAPWYGRGQSEHRLGRFLYDIKPRDSFALSTKVGRILSRPAWQVISPNRAFSIGNSAKNGPFRQTFAVSIPPPAHARRRNLISGGESFLRECLWVHRGPDGTPPTQPSNLALAGWMYLFQSKYTLRISTSFVPSLLVLCPFECRIYSSGRYQKDAWGIPDGAISPIYAPFCCIVNPLSLDFNPVSINVYSIFPPIFLKLYSILPDIFLFTGIPGGLEFDHRHDYTYDGLYSDQ